ncbi:MAG: Flp pilus assembly protein CpaB [Actinomycetia bacterium]|nr:Flp pilus assembly protein CpaB [Actinomycetes bacterium]
MHTRRKRLLISLASGIIAAACMALFASALKSEVGQTRAQAMSAYGGEQVEVYVADRDIGVGESLSTANVSRRTWLSELLPAGALMSDSDVLGKTLSLPLLANEPVCLAKLGNVQGQVGVAAGFSALSIPVDDVSAVGGAIQPGCQIALYATDGSQTRLIAAGVRVLQTSNNTTGSVGVEGKKSLLGNSGSRANLNWVTLEIKEDRVQEVIAASRNQKLYLVVPGGEQ